ncbi:putative DNA-binding domain-containing protein [Rhizobiales bacterium]|uniref:HvfC/BufC N-terminal domain-containing protein n=1 Tax=Hongsoonwoonella zoysiae TaxID=2821844 RepID=UPI001560B1DE|nr:putative DNA-binding domain-containing protein [Hongsoonwoonella zoysiae]NRG17331.1 putative DNA-binding domain-containing protein [Hongsoonwoonella zoysiae]
MPRLPDLQAEFSAALTQPDAAVPDGVTAPSGGRANKRFAVYRNNVTVSLTAALEDSFPAIAKLLGDEYFAALAREFIRRHQPSSPLLAEYGAEFGDFLDAFPPLAAYPYLGDVARLEHAWLSAYHAADAAPLDPARLSAIPETSLGEVRFTPHPALRILASRWPILTLFKANRTGEEGQPPDLSSGGESVLVTRPSLNVTLSRLSPGASDFLEALCGGDTLGGAAALAIEKTAEFDLGTALQTALAAGAFSDIRTPG